MSREPYVLSPNEGNRYYLKIAAKDRFVLTMRLYWPNETKPSILDGSWKPPGGQAGVVAGSVRGRGLSRSYAREPPIS